MKLVLDTNVVMELLHWQDPRSARLMVLIETGQVQCQTDYACLAELERVLAYPQFGRNEAERSALMLQYASLSTCVPPDDGQAQAPDLPRCRDRDDQKFMELAARCHADLLVTRDRELLKLARSRRHPAPFGILIPEAALEKIEAARSLPSEHPA